MASASICSIPTCDKPTFARGYCSAHYARLRAHGDPTAGRTPNGAVTEWLNTVAVPYEGDDCLAFPFSRMKSGHGHISSGHGTSLAHVYVATKVHGPKPSPEHESCHSCGNGHLGCVTPKHLYWGTRTQNMNDRKLHGVLVPPPRRLGEANHRSKLAEFDVLDIRARLARSESMTEIATRYDLTPSAIYAIKKRRSWGWMP